ncbi:uncharacterized protein [Centruroides vittatus]|uniref:uncharacterized protein n=1 Tax=Centruroides vittatus TaxID=120091 RepID=UPI00350F4C55
MKSWWKEIKSALKSKSGSKKSNSVIPKQDFNPDNLGIGLSNMNNLNPVYYRKANSFLELEWLNKHQIPDKFMWNDDRKFSKIIEIEIEAFPTKDSTAIKFNMNDGSSMVSKTFYKRPLFVDISDEDKKIKSQEDAEITADKEIDFEEKNPNLTRQKINSENFGQSDIEENPDIPPPCDGAKATQDRDDVQKISDEKSSEKIINIRNETSDKSYTDLQGINHSNNIENQIAVEKGTQTSNFALQESINETSESEKETYPTILEQESPEMVYFQSFIEFLTDDNSFLSDEEY